MLAIATVTIALAFTMRVNGNRVAFPFLPNRPIPELCGARAWFGISCPGCGLTRSFIHLAHGRWTAAYACHRMGWILALLTVAQIPYRALCLCGYPPFTRRQTNWVSRTIIAGLILNWALTCRVPWPRAA